ncbi:TetR/AcrR family transcriptional regulator [Thalassovita mangrovi]|uniref:TetR family transcriptional regulator n=1 Tax=Thalassovita mangrovi TaxID=2692236 RepID=A0A6L8LFZ2_9RHOB|nr:TetR/AcrR family transcriptional regulator [Thalassovita mangrovi]MYM55007.1 TetR family transcriptional regulator [Thalassovita mangrovi]
MTTDDNPDHRTRVGQQRRERMRARLIEAATLVFAERGPEAAQIEHVIQQAGVSRGTFYNYFRTTDELLLAAKNALGVEMITMVHQASDIAAPPSQRLAEGVKAFIDLIQRHPLLLEFTARLGMRNFDNGGLVPAATEELLWDVIDRDAAADLTPQMANDILQASTLAIMLRLRDGETVDIPAFVAAMLRMLGHPAAEAARVSERPFTPLDVPADSLITRSETARRTGMSSPRA